MAPLGRGDAQSPLGTVSERKGLERASDPARLAEGGPCLAAASKASGPEDPGSEHHHHPPPAPEDVSLTQRVLGSDSTGFPICSDRALPDLSIASKSMRCHWTSPGLGVGRPWL